MKRIKTHILSFSLLILFLSCTKKVSISELSIGDSPLKLELIENQDSIRVTYKSKVFSGIAEEFFGSQKPKSYMEFKNGLLHGRLTYFFENGNKKLEFNSNRGFLDGLLHSYFDNGNVKDESFFKNGKRIGTQRNFYKNGKISFLRYYDEQGLGSGIWERFDSLGRKEGTITMKYDKANGISEIIKYNNDEILEKSYINYLDGTLNGFAYKLNGKGDTLMSGSYKEGKLDGLVRILVNERNGNYTLTKYSNGKKTEKSSLYNKNGEKIIVKPKKKLKPYEGTFVSTRRNMFGKWVKIEIENSTIKLWEVRPDFGAWGSPKYICELKTINNKIYVSERRYSDTGRKLSRIFSEKNCGYTIELRWSGSQYDYEINGLGVYPIKKVSKNYSPW